MTDRHTRPDRALAAAWALAWVGLCAYVALSIPAWLAWLRASGTGLGPLQLLLLDVGAALRTAPGVLLAMVAILIGTSPGLGRSGWASRIWFGLGLIQVLALAVVCQAFFSPPQPQGAGELARCGTSVIQVPVTVFFCLAAPLMAFQAAVWSTFTWSALREPRGSLVSEVRAAAIIAALPSLAAAVALHRDGNLRWRGPEWLAVPVPLAASITAGGLLVFVALSWRLRETAGE